MEMEGVANGNSSESGKAQRSRMFEKGRKSEIESGHVWDRIRSFLMSKSFLKLKPESRAKIETYVDNLHDELTDLQQMMEKVKSREIRGKEPATGKRGVKGIQIRSDDKHQSVTETLAPRNFDFLLILDMLKQFHAEFSEILKPGAYSLEDLSVVELFPKTEESLRRARFSLDTVKGAKGRDKTSPRISTSELEIEEAKEMGGEAKRTVRAEIYSFLDLISKNVMKLKAESTLRISCYSRDEIQIHMDNMHSDVTNLLLMTEIPGKEDFDFHLSILKRLQQIHTELVEEENRSDKDALESKSISELFKETQDILTKTKVETEIEARETNEAPHKFSLDAVSGAKGMDEVSRRISTSGLEIEEANEMGGEAKGRDAVWLRILNSGLEIEEDKETGREAKGRDEVSLRISTSTETKLEMEEAKGMLEEAKMRKVLTEEESFDWHRRGWVSKWSALCGTFTETTTLSPMHFTHSTPGHTPFAAFVASTLQMYSIKVTEIKDALGLKWPLRVYGVVAARDTVDQNRNIIFSRRRDDYQELSEQDPFLRLTGPSRAIVAEEPVRVEIELKVKGTTKSEDRVLMSWVWYYSDRLCTLYTPLAGKFCTLVLSSEELEKSVQATIVGVQLTKGKPDLFKYGGRVVCSSPPRKGILPASKHITVPSFRQVVLEDGAMDLCSNGYLTLSRHVVSVELCGRLEIHIYEYSQSRGIAEHGRVSIKAQSCNVTQHKCRLGDAELEISVAWSRLVRDKEWISFEGRVEL